MTYPLKFRQHVLAIRQKEGLSFSQTAERFGVGMASVMRWAKNVQPVTRRNKPATKIDGERLAQDVLMYPDAYLRERAQRFGVSKTGIEMALKRLGLSRKKHLRIRAQTNKPENSFRRK
jgi:transposase